METAAIRTDGLTRRFGALTAVEEVTLSVASGQFFGFLGPNGAGKSTTIKMLTGLLEPSAGTVEILGERFTASALELKSQIGVVPEGMALLGRLNAPEYLRFVGRMYGLDGETTNRRTEELLEFMQLANERKKLITDFSHGMQNGCRGDSRTEGAFSGRAFRRRGCDCRRDAEKHVAGNDPAGSYDILDHARS